MVDWRRNRTKDEKYTVYTVVLDKYTVKKSVAE
nr:MAG TPA: hypothetical protein [Caudoviricetes sp.]